MTKTFRAEPYVKVVERSEVLIRAPRAVPRRMALTLLLGLAVFWVPMLMGGMPAGAALLAGIPLALFLSTFRGANTLRVEPERLTLRRHYLCWSLLLAQVKTTEVKDVRIESREDEVYLESPLAPLAALMAGFGIHAQFGGRKDYVDVLDLVLELASGDRVVVITSHDRETLEAARAALADRLRAGRP